MNKLITFLLFGCVISSSAQISYLETDAPKTGVNISTRKIDSLSLLDLVQLKDPGGNKNWDVRGLYTNSGESQYIGIQNLYFKSHFPGTNLALVKIPNPDSSYTMLEKNSGGLFLLGTRNNSTEIVFAPKIMLYSFPLSFGMNYQNDATADYTLNNINYGAEFHSYSIVDSWGMMTTNDGSYPAIKIKTTRLQYVILKSNGDIKANSTIESHSWLISGLAEPLVTLTSQETVIDTFSITDTSLTNTYKQEIVRNQDIQKSGLKMTITPNPVSDQVSIQCQNINFNFATYAIVNADGKTVMDGNLSANEILHLNVNQLAGGSYLVQMILDKKTLVFDIFSKL